MRTGSLLLATSALLLSLSAVAQSEAVFDPARDPAKDLRAAQVEARAQHKNILLDVGGNWCVWCKILDRTIRTTPELQTLVAKDYVVVHVNWSPENENAAFLKPFGTIEGFPHLMVLSPDGKVLANTETDVFETNHKSASGYNVSSLSDFFRKYEAHTAAQ